MATTKSNAKKTAPAKAVAQKNAEIKFSSKFNDLLSNVYVGEAKKSFVKKYETVDSFALKSDKAFCSCIKSIRCVEGEGKYGHYVKIVIALAWDGKNFTSDLDVEEEKSVWCSLAKACIGNCQDGESIDFNRVGIMKVRNTETGKEYYNAVVAPNK